MSPAEVLSCPHLMLSDTGTDNNILLIMGGLSVQFFYYFLWLDHSPFNARYVCERIVCFPFLDVGEPRLAGGCLD